MPKIEINNKTYDLEIEYKNNKNMYLRVKDDLSIHIYAPKYITDREINRFINQNHLSIIKMLNAVIEKQNRLADKFLFLGQSYDIYYIENKDIYFGSSKVFIPKKLNIDTWYKKKAQIIFKEHFDKCYQNFKENIPYPKLQIRKMTSKWGVCNVTKKTVTLNLNLIKINLKYLDYVIVHELSHLIYANHSSSFWSIVEEYTPNYKELRKEMKNII